MVSAGKSTFSLLLVFKHAASASIGCACGHHDAGSLVENAQFPLEQALAG